VERGIQPSHQCSTKILAITSWAKGVVWRRAGHAALRIFITPTESGKNQFNCSELVGSALAAAPSNAYHPPHDRTAPNSANIWLTHLWGDALGFELKEFWPDIRRKLHKK
jgi:hypothetical protein